NLHRRTGGGRRTASCLSVQSASNAPACRRMGPSALRQRGPLVDDRGSVDLGEGVRGARRTAPAGRLIARDAAKKFLMTSLWPLTMALSAIEAEIWSSTELGAAGLIEPQADGRVRLEIRTRSTISSSFLHPDELESAGTLGRLRAMWSLDPPIRTPLG